MLPFLSLLLFPVIDIAPGPPPLSDLDWLPCAAVVQDNIVFGRAHIAWLEKLDLYDWETREGRSQWIKDAYWCYNCWDVLRDARCETYSHEYKRARLNWLREQLGWQQYYAGVLPASTPVWRFKRME
jgi:hypothetical protein